MPITLALPTPVEYEPDYLTNYDEPTQALLATLSIAAAPGCPVHLTLRTPLYPCQDAINRIPQGERDLKIYEKFILEWREYLLRNTPATLKYHSDLDGPGRFMQAYGSTPECFAEVFRMRIFRSNDPDLGPAWTKAARSDGKVVEMMLKYWQEWVKEIRATCDDSDRIGKEIVQEMMACQPGDADWGMYSAEDESLMPMLPTPLKKLRVERVKLPGGTRITLLPLRPRLVDGKNLGTKRVYEIVGALPSESNQGRKVGHIVDKELLTRLVKTQLAGHGDVEFVFQGQMLTGYGEEEAEDTVEKREKWEKPVAQERAKGEEIPDSEEEQIE